MAAPKITYANKEDRRNLDTVLQKNKVTMAEMNEIKTVVNALADYIDTLTIVVNFSISASDFSGSNYQNALLITKLPYTDFNVYTNEGSGSLLRFGEGYTFDSPSGTIIMTPGKYLVQIYKSASA